MSSTSLASKRPRWRRHFERVYSEQIEPLRRHLAIFGVFQETVRKGKVRRLSGAHELADWMAVNYLVFSSTWVRKTAEPRPLPPKKPKKKKGQADRRSLSLRKLLEEIQAEAESLTFERFRRLFRGTKVPLGIIRDQWERNFGKLDSVSPQAIERDICAIERATKRVKKFVDKQVAHTALNRRLHIETSFGEIREAIECLSGLLRKYQLLLFGIAPHEPDLSGELTGIRDLLRGLWEQART